MIYAGFIRFNGEQLNVKKLTSILHSLIDQPIKLLEKEPLALCYGGSQQEYDIDGIWENHTSIILGRIFDKTHYSPVEKKGFKGLSHLSKEKVLENIWGKYVYLNANESSNCYEIVVDITGQLPFFYHRLPNGNIIFSSNIEIIARYLPQKIEYSWGYLCSYNIYGNSCSILTPFQHIYELPPGCTLKITKDDNIIAPFWNPLSPYKSTNLHKKNAAEILQKTLKPWITPYKNICVSLSGGLDSSSLVYCLKDIIGKDQTLTALNYYHSQIQSSNELIHARKVCQETNIKLIEMDASSSLPFDPPRNKQALIPNKPYPGLVSLKWLETIRNQIPSDGSFTFVSGHGSDHIFMRPPSKKSFSDYLLENGLKGSNEKLKQITQFYRESYFPILKDNLSSIMLYFLRTYKRKRHPKSVNDERPDWFRKELIKNTSDNFAHPIYQYLPGKTLPGKYNQIDLLYEGLASIHVELINQVDPTYYPFLYEPVVEFALSYPTYDLFDNGYDRYPLRKAVSDYFKTDTVWRRDKSQTTGLFQLGIKQNLEYVLELCLEGHFVKNGFVDKEGLHKTVRLLANGDIKYLWPFTHIASTEIFLRHWNEKVL